LNKRIAYLWAPALLAASGVQAGGLWLNEFGDPSGGRASAGASAGVDDASVALHNAAGMGRLEGDQLLLSVAYLAPDAEFDLERSTPGTGGNDGGSAGVGSPGASAFYTNDLDSERWSAGVSFAALSGAGLDYNNSWAGRYQVQEVTILLVALAPAIGYQVTDKFSVGASVQLWYTSLDMDIAIANPLGGDDGKAEIDGDDYDTGFTVSALYEITPNTRLGIRYQSDIDTDYDSDLKIKPFEVELDANLNLPLSQQIRVGLHHELTDRLGMDITLGWDDWSTFNEVFISTDAGPGGAIDQNWEDTYKFSLGFQYRLNNQWRLTSGMSYDSSPQEAKRRTADLPVDEQIRYAAGATYEMRDGFTIGGYVNYADLGDARINSERYGGEYSTNALLSLSLNFSWRLGD
jgi:long-chain fatty acid transport protein